MIQRVRDRATFDAFRRQGRGARRGPITVVYVSAEGPVQVAFGIGRKVGSAVVRNRLRRRLRQAMRELTRDGHLEPGAYLLIVRPDAVGIPYVELASRLRDACEEVLG